MDAGELLVKKTWCIHSKLKCQDCSQNNTPLPSPLPTTTTSKEGLEDLLDRLRKQIEAIEDFGRCRFVNGFWVQLRWALEAEMLDSDTNLTLCPGGLKRQQWYNPALANWATGQRSVMKCRVRTPTVEGCVFILVYLSTTSSLPTPAHARPFRAILVVFVLRCSRSGTDARSDAGSAAFLDLTLPPPSRKRLIFAPRTGRSGEGWSWKELPGEGTPFLGELGRPSPGAFKVFVGLLLGYWHGTAPPPPIHPLSPPLLPPPLLSSPHFTGSRRVVRDG